MPQLVKSLSSLYSNRTIGLLVTIPYLAGLLAMVLVSGSSDRKMERKFHVAVPALVAGIGLVLLGATHSAFPSIFFYRSLPSASSVSMGPIGLFRASF